jgi:replication factor A1
VGKPVQQLLRATTAASQLPAEIARIVSWRFTFAVTLTQQSYYRENKTYQVNSVVTAHGQHEPAAPTPQPAAPGSPTTPIASGAGDGSLSVRAATDFTPPSSSVTEAEHSLVRTDQVSHASVSLISIYSL